MGGNICVISEKGKGMIFIFRFFLEVVEIDDYVFSEFFFKVVCIEILLIVLVVDDV